jgi:hypothetical protein
MLKIVLVHDRGDRTRVPVAGADNHAAIARAKGAIEDARKPYAVPERSELPRLASVLAVVYLVYNEATHRDRTRSSDRAAERGGPSLPPARRSPAERGRGDHCA